MTGKTNKKNNPGGQKQPIDADQKKKERREHFKQKDLEKREKLRQEESKNKQDEERKRPVVHRQPNPVI